MRELAFAKQLYKLFLRDEIRCSVRNVFFVFSTLDAGPGRPLRLEMSKNKSMGLKYEPIWVQNESSKVPPVSTFIIGRYHYTVMSLTVMRREYRNLRRAHPDRVLWNDLSQTSFHDRNSGSMKITTSLDHFSHCKTSSGTDWSNRLTHRAFIINTPCGQIIKAPGSKIIPRPQN